MPRIFAFILPVFLLMLSSDSKTGAAALHVTIIGSKDDSNAFSLFHAAMEYPSSNKKVEWFDKNEKPMTDSEIKYPNLKKAAAFICNNHQCSRPAFQPKDLIELLDRFQK